MPKVSAEHKTKVKENITNAAIKNFSKNGYAITKMDDIAKTADVSKGTLYLYFQSKEDLFESICKSNQRILIDERSDLFQSMGKIRHDLGLFYDNFLRSLQDTQKIRIEALAESVHNPKLRKIIQKNRKEIESNVEEFLKGMKKAGFFVNNPDMRAVSSGVISLFDGLILSELVGTNHEENKKAWVKTMMAIFEGTGIKN